MASNIPKLIEHDPAAMHQRIQENIPARAICIVSPPSQIYPDPTLREMLPIDSDDDDDDTRMLGNSQRKVSAKLTN